MIAQITCSALLLVANRLVRYCGSVMESLETLLNFLSLLAQKIQLAAVPIASPIPIQICPNPNASTDPGRPMSSHADMSDACADIAATHGPIVLPPRK